MKNMKANMLQGVNIRTLEEPPPKKRNKETAMLKEKWKQLEILPPSAGKSSSPDDQQKKSVIINKGKEKMSEPPAKPTKANMWETMPVGFRSKGIVIGLPHRSPLSVHENATKAKDKTPPTQVMRTESKTPKRRINRVQRNVAAAPSCGKMIYPQDVVDAGIHLNPAAKKHSAWFSLTPFCDQKDTLQLLVEPYVQIIMDGNSHPDVSILMKYIVLQLKHVCQDEVGIFINGKLLAPEMKLLDVVKQWTTVVDSERKIAKIGSSAENFCVKLTYGRRA